MEIVRLNEVDAARADELNRLFDAEKVWNSEQGRRFLRNPDNALLLARWNGTACGFLTAHRLQRFDRRRAGVLLYEIVVAEAFRRRGIGAALITAVREWAREVGADEVWVLADRGNTAAMAMYAATGGEEDHRETVMFTYRIAST
jgi:GNAT superfamily N-acetyltransferase